jgi:hypothetical protein
VKQRLPLPATTIKVASQAIRPDLRRMTLDRLPPANLPLIIF